MNSGPWHTMSRELPFKHWERSGNRSRTRRIGWRLRDVHAARRPDPVCVPLELRTMLAFSLRRIVPGPVLRTAPWRGEML